MRSARILMRDTAAGDVSDGEDRGECAVGRNARSKVGGADRGIKAVSVPVIEHLKVHFAKEGR